MGKYLNPFTDVGFKKLFGQEANKELLIAFLNDLLAGERRIEDLVFMDKEIVPESQNGRVIIFDILCKETGGTQFIVEMQNQYQDYFFNRGLYYMCRTIVEQGKRGSDWIYDIYPVYGIYFLNFRLPRLNEFRTDLIISNQKTGERMIEEYRQIYLSLPHFTLEREECRTDFERWIYLLKNMETIGITPFDSEQRAIFKKLLDVANVESLTPEERRRYEANLKAYRDYNNIIASAQRISREKGRAEGKAEGIAEGRMEERRLLAINLKQEGLGLELIHKLTGLPTQEIDKLT